jgi:rubrerythrin
MSGGRSAGGVPGCAGQTDTCEACSDNPVVGSLSEVETSALRAALEDEYRARALYEQALADLNSVRPLANIKRAEERHIAMLENMFTRYGLEIPPVQEGGQDGTFATLAHACAAGVTAETTNVALYDQLLPQLDNPDLIRVFTALQRASETRHLPALESCAP